jgi:hypothetical protein
MSDERVIKNNGKFEQGDLADYWETYTIAERRNLLELMLKDHFEVCYQIPNTKSYIAPQLLEVATPTYHWNSPTALKFRYQYPFMPKGLIARLIVRVNEWIASEADSDLVWKKGVVIEKDNCQAQIIQKNTKDNVEVIDIEISGENRNQKFVLKMVCDEIERIHKKSIEHSPQSKMIPCICSTCKASENPHFYKYETLLKYEQKGKAKATCDISIDDVSVLGLLEGVFDKNKMRQISEQKRHGRLVIEGDNDLIKHLTKPVQQINHNQIHNGIGDNVAGNKTENNQGLAKAEEKQNIKNIEKELLDKNEITELQDMLSHNEIPEVLEILKPKIKGDNLMILVESRFNEIKQDKQKGLLTYQEFRKEKQQIINDLSEIIDEW